MKQPPQPTYHDQLEVNEALFKEVFKRVYPEFFVLMDIVQQNRVNVFILFRIVRHLVTISSGSGWGDVKILIKRGKVIQIEGSESDHVIEDIKVGNDVVQS